MPLRSPWQLPGHPTNSDAPIVNAAGAICESEDCPCTGNTCRPCASTAPNSLTLRFTGWTNDDPACCAGLNNSWSLEGNPDNWDGEEACVWFTNLSLCDNTFSLITAHFGGLNFHSFYITLSGTGTNVVWGIDLSSILGGGGSNNCGLLEDDVSLDDSNLSTIPAQLVIPAGVCGNALTDVSIEVTGWDN